MLCYDLETTHLLLDDPREKEEPLDLVVDGSGLVPGRQQIPADHSRDTTDPLGQVRWGLTQEQRSESEQSHRLDEQDHTVRLVESHD